MQDNGQLPHKGLPPAERAVKYILDVLPQYPELAWYLGPGTEMLHLLCEAEARRLDVSPSRFEVEYGRRLRPANPKEGCCVCPDCGGLI
jgi:hypothetical protein